MTLDDITALPHHYRITIPDEYLDIFQHMNVTYYLKIFNDSVWEMLNDLGMDQSFFNTHDLGFYAVDQRLSYKAEVKAEETVATYSRFFARSSKSLHFMKFMVNETRIELAATMEVLAFNVNRTEKKTKPYLNEVAAVLDERITAHQALAWHAPLSSAIRVK